MTRAMGLAAAAAIASGALPACHHASRTPAAQPLSAAAPLVDSVVPASVSVHPGDVVRVVVWGHGFIAGREPGRNTIRIGSYDVRNVPANDSGTQISFVVPATIATGEAPPRPLAPGAYPIVVVSGAASSNAVTLRVTP